MQSNTYRIKKNNYYRTLITETLPAEVPIIFSNDGFYANCHLKKKNNNYHPFKIFENLISGTDNSYTIPFNYKVRKNDLSVRNLTLLHPRIQLEIVEFYKTYDSLICFYTSKSDASLRSPQKVASTYYIKNSESELNKYRSNGILNEYEDLIFRHSSSYFSYRGFKKIHRFYDSPSFNTYEATYSKLWFMDVAKCFDSIYTHSLSWACKDKIETKSNLKISSTFANIFDTLMQRSNYNETSGIIIGPEISRIFAEIIFQEIDAQLFTEMKKKNFISGKDFVFKRYVDDCFIFANNDEVAQSIYDTYSDILNKFKMHVNVNKVEKLKRPFLTKKSKIIFDTNISLTTFFDSFTEYSSWNDRKILKPTKIYKPKSLSLHFINSIKNICSKNDSPYDSIASYVISACVKRIEEIVIYEEIISEADENYYKDTLMLILDVLYFFYSVAPSVNSSYKLAKGVLLIISYAEKYLSTFENTIKNKIYANSCEILCKTDELNFNKRENFLSLEKINLLLSISDLDADYSLPPDDVENLFNLNFDTNKITYYHLISCLYYTKNKPRYLSINSKLNKIISTKLVDLNDLNRSSENAHLFLDALSCPYIDRSTKSSLIKKFYIWKSLPTPTAAVVNDIIQYMEHNPWFVGWTRINILNMLERKELMQTYS